MGNFDLPRAGQPGASRHLSPPADKPPPIRTFRCVDRTIYNQPQQGRLPMPRLRGSVCELLCQFREHRHLAFTVPQRQKRAGGPEDAPQDLRFPLP